MLNLIRFLSRNVFFIQFLLLEIFCFYLLVKNNNYQHASFISSSSELTGSVYETYDGFTAYLQLAGVNQDLADENASFRNKQRSAYTKVFGKNVLINDTTYHQKYVYISGKIINKSVNQRNNFFTLNKGEMHGIKPGMGVTTGHGLLGIVKNTSEHFSSIMTILHKDMSVSAKVKKNNYFGSVVWDGKNYRTGQLMHIPVHVDLSIGDTIVTSGYSAIFPENVPIGIIKSFETPKGKNFFDIEITFTTDYKKVAYAYVIKNLFKIEQTELEALSEEHDQ